MRRLAYVVVDGLFGHMKHEISVRRNDPTIITAPNGAGKTHILILIRAALGLDFASLFRTSFQHLKIAFTDKSSLSIMRSDMAEKGWQLQFGIKSGDRPKSLTIDESFALSVDDEIPPYFRQVGSGRWLDMRHDRLVRNEFIDRRYRKNYRNKLSELAKKPAYRELVQLVSELQPIMIDTKRLDAVVPRSSYEDRDTFRPGDTTVASSSIMNYIDQIRIQVVEARRSSIQATQSADLSFAARALAAAKATVKEASLHTRYDEIVEKYEELARNGLAVGDAPLEFPEETTPTVRRILKVFLDDWEKRLQPLWPLNEKIQTLREILDAKLKQSGKSTSMNQRGELMFRTSTGRRIRVSSLSSGEQHLVALFTHLLFSASQGAVVLIDEPEISMHAAWKHAFLEDIGRVAKLANLQVIMATHSSAIVNGRWDLAEELSFSLEASRGEGDEADFDLEAEDVLE